MREKERERERERIREGGEGNLRVFCLLYMAIAIANLILWSFPIASNL